jgi:hypothetical protein
VGALIEVGRDMGWGWKVKLLTFVGPEAPSGVWVSARGALRKEPGRSPSPKVEVERDQGRTGETAAGRAKQGFQEDHTNTGQEGGNIQAHTNTRKCTNQSYKYTNMHKSNRYKYTNMHKSNQINMTIINTIVKGKHHGKS